MAITRQLSFLESGKEVFSPSRLTLARERRGWTRRALADKLDVSADAITKFEKGRCRPTRQNIEAMALHLGFPLIWFYSPEITLLPINAPSFRGRRSMSAELKAKATRAGDLAASVIWAELNQRFVMPAVEVPNFEGRSPESAAEELRRLWGLGNGPISNMVHLLESKGVGVFWLQEESPALDAWSVWHLDRPYVLLNIRTDAGCRARFDAAHELGHLVLHQNARIIDGLDLEKQANQFAAAFLMPPEQFALECPRLPVLKYFFPLKKRWKVSIAAMVMQCQTMGVFSQWEARHAFGEIASKGWRTQEPVEIALPRETSRLHQMLYQKLEGKGITSAQFSHDCGIRLSDVWELMPVFREEFHQQQAQENKKAAPSLDRKLRLVA